MSDFCTNPRDQLGAFLAYLAFQGKAVGTRDKYAQALRPFIDWLSERTAAGVTAEDIWMYLGEWSQSFEERYGRQPKINTRRNQVTALKALYHHLETFDLLIDGTGAVVRNPMLRIETPAAEKTDNDFLSSAEDQALVAAPISAQERILIFLLRHTGMRVSEACALRISDIHLIAGNRRIIVRKSKSNAGMRTIPMFPELLPQILAWLTELQELGLYHLNAPLLSTRSGKQMQTSYVDRVVKRVAWRADVRTRPCTCGSAVLTRHSIGCPRTQSGDNRSEISSHTLRRTFATDLRNRGLPIDSISKLLGHASTATTESYYSQLLDPTIKKELAESLGWAA